MTYHDPPVTTREKTTAPAPTTESKTTAEATPAPTTVNTTSTGTETTAEADPALTIFDTNTETKTPTMQPAAQSGLTTTTKVGIAVGLVGAVCLGLLGALAIYIRRRRATHDATLNPFSKLDEGGSYFFQSTSALYGEFNIRTFHL